MALFDGERYLIAMRGVVNVLFEYMRPDDGRFMKLVPDKMGITESGSLVLGCHMWGKGTRRFNIDVYVDPAHLVVWYMAEHPSDQYECHTYMRNVPHFAVKQALRYIDDTIIDWMLDVAIEEHHV